MIYEELIPTDHLLRKLTTAVDLSFVSDLVSDCYCPDNGRRQLARQMIGRDKLVVDQAEGAALGAVLPLHSCHHPRE